MPITRPVKPPATSVDRYRPNGCCRPDRADPDDNLNLAIVDFDLVVVLFIEADREAAAPLRRVDPRPYLTGQVLLAATGERHVRVVE